MADIRKVGVCSGCGSLRPIIDVKNGWCDACRKKVARHPGEYPSAVLATTDRQSPRIVSNGKLYKLDATMKKLIAEILGVGALKEVIAGVRKIVEPFPRPLPSS